MQIVAMEASIRFKISNLSIGQDVGAKSDKSNIHMHFQPIRHTENLLTSFSFTLLRFADTTVPIPYWNERFRRVFSSRYLFFSSIVDESREREENIVTKTKKKKCEIYVGCRRIDGFKEKKIKMKNNNSRIAFTFSEPYDIYW